jgi:hypothetical protein
MTRTEAEKLALAAALLAVLLILYAQLDYYYRHVLG